MKIADNRKPCVILSLFANLKIKPICPRVFLKRSNEVYMVGDFLVVPRSQVSCRTQSPTSEIE